MISLFASIFLAFILFPDLISCEIKTTTATLLHQFESFSLKPEQLQDLVTNLNSFRLDLLSAGYTASGIERVLNIQPQQLKDHGLAMMLTSSRRSPKLDNNIDNENKNKNKTTTIPNSSSSEVRLATMIKLFYLGESVPFQTLQSFTDPPFLSQNAQNALNILGLWFISETGKNDTEDSKTVSFGLQLHPLLDDLLIASDFSYNMMGNAQSWGHAVMYLGIDSHALVDTIAAESESCTITSLMDLCTGTGVQGISRARSCNALEDMILVDANPRAVRFARFNLILNAHVIPFLSQQLVESNDPISMVTFLQKTVIHKNVTELYSELKVDLNAESESEIPNILKKQRQFDLILANPPYLPDPDAAETLFGGGGVLGDVVVLDIFRDVIPNYLSKKIGSRMLMVLTLSNTATLAERLHKAWNEGGGLNFQANCNLKHVHGGIMHPATWANWRKGINDEGLAFGSKLWKSGVVDISPASFLVFTVVPDDNQDKEQDDIKQVCVSSVLNSSCTMTGFTYYDIDLGYHHMWRSLVGMTNMIERKRCLDAF
jgi:16S rRNA G966 N2-methylase RsmD